MSYKQFYALSSGNLRSVGMSTIAREACNRWMCFSDNPWNITVMNTEHVAKALPVIKIKGIPYQSFPIDCSIESLTDYLTSKGYSVVNWTQEGYIGDSIVFYSYYDFTIASRSREDFETIWGYNPERVIYYPEQLILD